MSSSKPARGWAFAGALLILGAGLSACTYDPHPEILARAQALNPTEQFGVKVTERPEELALGLHPGGLTPSQQAALGQLVERWREDGGGPVLVRAPAGAQAGLAMAQGARALLGRLGVPPERIRLTSYAAPAGAPLVVGYSRFEALGPNCSGGWADLTTTGGNAPYDHFGCATTGNLAAMVANPRDLLAPAVETPADDSRRQVVFGHYRRGELTSSVADPQASGHASDTGSN